MDVVRTRRRTSAPLAALLAAVLLMAMAAVPVAAGAEQADGELLLDPADGLAGEFETASVVEVVLGDAAEAQLLADIGVDVAAVLDSDGALVAHVVVTSSEQAALEAHGFQVGAAVYTESDWEQRIAEREALIEAKAQGLTSGPTPAVTGWSDSVFSSVSTDSFDAAASEPSTLDLDALGDDLSTTQTDDVMILRANYMEGRIGNAVGQWVYVEAKTSAGQAQNFSMTVHRDSGPGTEIGSGGTQNLGRFFDAGQYMYHRGRSSVSVRPQYVMVTSPNGGSAIAPVTDWLPLEEDDEEGAPYLVDFIDHYLTPNELYARIHELAAQYPHLAEVVQLPYLTNGYRRHAQVLHGTTTSNAVVVTSHVYGHEGGNDISVNFVNPGAPDQPLTVSVDGNDITVSLATSSTGALASTASQVVAAINSHPEASALVHSHTYRGNAGNGIKQAGGPAQLSDFLNAPDSVSREPHPVYVLRIGKHRDGSRMGVLAYAQEHAREWVTPLVTIEAAERLLHNYARHARTRRLVDNLDIWIMPSHNPDGSNYSFYNFASQRKNMTNYCPTTGAADPNARNSWGVDNNRNYGAYNFWQGYSGSSGSCTSGTYRGPSELSEPENRNLVWVVDENPNIRFAMNLHSFGDYFMWSPGTYATPGRIAAPRPTLAEEDYFWYASKRILTEIKRSRGTVVEPARTGPIIDVLYSAAGNSGDHLWYLNNIYAWNFEVGRAGFQPAWPEAHQQTLEFANGLIEMFQVALDFSRDNRRPSSRLSHEQGTYEGPVTVSFELSEPADVYYTLDGSRPTYDSARLSATGVREGPETFTVTETTTFKWFSVDQAGNVENNYNPNSTAENYNKATITID